ncbi:MAG TPA: hypothetical protein VL092_04315 [Chitinophagaceae bacterium]|nr:hypothetical protein [Chitinophagaceae bacterium]
MKNTILILIGCLQLTACCTKQGCAVNYREKPLVFNGFNIDDLDTLLLVRYQSATDFKNVIDSFVTHATDDYLLSYIINLDEQQYAFKIYLPATGQTYFIDHFSYKRVKDCNSCFPARPKSAYEDAFTSYTLNGKKQFGDFITIEQ